MDVDEVTALIVNYNTPKLLSDAAHSIRNFYNVPIMVMDGSEPLKHEQMMEIISDIDVKVERVSHNITHGPGLKYGMDRIQTQYVMTMDSDAQMIKRGFLETCLSSMDEQS
jgi:GT2 family glycosyltransferase